MRICLCTLQGHTSWLSAVAFSHDPHRLWPHSVHLHAVATLVDSLAAKPQLTAQPLKQYAVLVYDYGEIRCAVFNQEERAWGHLNR